MSSPILLVERIKGSSSQLGLHLTLVTGTHDIHCHHTVRWSQLPIGDCSLLPAPSSQNVAYAMWACYSEVASVPRLPPPFVYNTCHTILPLAWHLLFENIIYVRRVKFWKVGVIPRMGEATHAHPWYDNDKDLKVCFLVTRDIKIYC